MSLSPISTALVIFVITTQIHAGPLDWLLNVSPRQYLEINEFIYRNLGLSTRMNRNVNVQAKLNKRQIRIPNEVPFPCDVKYGRSPERPTSVHALRPGDIDVIGAMGDSLTAGYGALAVDILNVYVGNRGVSFSIGGSENWRSALTLPNILLEFNPSLVGYSIGDALSWQRGAQFNVAEAFSISKDMPYQASILIKRMKNDKRVNFELDWKVVTIMIGYNDICSFMCYENLKAFLQEQCKSLIKALDILYSQMPRVLVNIVPVTNVNRVFYSFTEKPPMCESYNSVECSCVNGLQFVNRRQKHNAVIDAWILFVENIMTIDRYKNKDDFAVVVQPFTTAVTFPMKLSRRTGRNATDYSYLSPDCYHFSQKGHAVAANALWNNMLEPVGNKSRDWDVNIMARFKCPPAQHPFIFTSGNSQ